MSKLPKCPSCGDTADPRYRYRGRMMCHGCFPDESTSSWTRKRIDHAINLTERLEAAERERDEAQANYRFMVEKAADEKLDGYRELGQRVATAENNADDLARRVKDLEEALASSLTDNMMKRAQSYESGLKDAGLSSCERCGRVRVPWCYDCHLEQEVRDESNEAHEQGSGK